MSDEELLALAATITVKSSGVEYRLYYNVDGGVVTYTTQDLPGNYIKITKEQYAEARADALVRDGVLTYTHRYTHIVKLAKNSMLGQKTSKYDVNIITEVDPAYWKLVTYEIK